MIVKIGMMTGRGTIVIIQSVVEEVAICKYFLKGSCRNGSSCRFSHEEEDMVKKRGGLGSAFEDYQESEDGEVRPTKRFRGYDGEGLGSSISGSSTGAGRGRGRGRDINKPAWMTQGLTGKSSTSSAPLTIGQHG